MVIKQKFLWCFGSYLNWNKEEGKKYLSKLMNSWCIVSRVGSNLKINLTEWSFNFKYSIFVKLWMLFDAKVPLLTTQDILPPQSKWMSNVEQIVGNIELSSVLFTVSINSSTENDLKWQLNYSFVFLLTWMELFITG